jgi:uncharacterized protein YybS (DUF2232 family)
MISPGMAGLFSLLLFASLRVFPPVGIFLALLAPLPLVHVVATGRPSFAAWGWVAVVLMGAVLVWHEPWMVVAASGYLLVAVWPAVSVETWVRRPWTTGRWAAIVTLAALGIAAGVMAAVFYPAPPAEAFARIVTSRSAEVSETVKLLGEANGAEELVAKAIRFATYLAPALVAQYVLTAALWLRPRIALLGLPRGSEPFTLYASEEWLPVGFALGGLGWVFAPEPVKWLAANLLVTVLGLYFIHGLAIILFYLGRRFGGNRWIRLGVVVFALQVPVALMFSALGLTDTFFRLRRSGNDDGGREP